MTSLILSKIFRCQPTSLNMKHLAIYFTLHGYFEGNLDFANKFSDMTS